MYFTTVGFLSLKSIGYIRILLNSLQYSYLTISKEIDVMHVTENTKGTVKSQ